MARPAFGSAAWAQSQARLPFVACKSDGQLGPRPGPLAGGAPPAVPSSLAPELAYYASTELGVVAPRGWHCFGLYGSSGATLFVTPQRHNANYFLNSNKKLSGPALQFSLSLRDTSGRFKVAQVAARLFPKHRALARRIIREGIMPASDFPFGPFPHDVLMRRGDDGCEFRTPPMTQGMGTMSRLSVNADPIDGVAIMTRSGDLILLDIRTAPDQRRLIAAIIEATRSQSEALPIRR